MVLGETSERREQKQMSDVPLFLCPECEGGEFDIEVILNKRGHRVPGVFKCKTPGCSWEGKMRKLVWMDFDEASAKFPHMDLRPINERLLDTKAFTSSGPTSAAYRDKGAGGTGRKKRQKQPVGSGDSDSSLLSTEPLFKLPEKSIKDVLPEIDEGLRRTTPLICDDCGEPVVEVWFSGQKKLLWNGQHWNTPGSTISDGDFLSCQCSVCGGQFGVDKITCLDIHKDEQEVGQAADA